MTRREEIIYATLELASEQGLGAVTLSQIAQRVGIRKPSLYNHFASKDELVSEMYRFLREQARQRSVAWPVVPTAFPEDASLEQLLLDSYLTYHSFVMDDRMLTLFKVLYSERCTSKVAAQIVLEETEHMVANTKALFYALVVHGKMRGDSVDEAALSFALTIHGLVDRHLDMVSAGREEAPAAGEVPADVRAYIGWFSRQMEAHDHA